MGSVILPFHFLHPLRFQHQFSRRQDTTKSNASTAETSSATIESVGASVAPVALGSGWVDLMGLFLSIIRWVNQVSFWWIIPWPKKIQLSEFSYIQIGGFYGSVQMQSHFMEFWLDLPVFGCFKNWDLMRLNHHFFHHVRNCGWWERIGWRLVYDWIGGHI